MKTLLKRNRGFWQIVALCVVVSILYGLIHDQITARICIEYFTIYHPMIVKTYSPTLLGLFWGIVATFWVGLLLGIPLAWVAQQGSEAPYSARHFYRPLALLVTIMGLGAICAGYIGYQFAAKDSPLLLQMVPANIPADKIQLFTVDLFAHNASYMLGFLGGGWLIFTTWRKRMQTS